jgi:tetratricopeptide (TPR) repeat protein
VNQTWILWYLISALTGNPIGALLALLLIGWLGDRFSFRLFPRPWRALARWQRAQELRRVLSTNPHDRRARLELADLVLARDPAEAAALTRSNIEAGDEDPDTVFLFGAALARCGERSQAEHVLARLREQAPEFRLDEADLELGRLRLRQGDFAGAREALERLVAARPGTVEGRWYLVRALEGLGEREAGRRMRLEGWREYKTLPRFRRREERGFAMRLRPARAALVIGLALAAIVAVVLAAASACGGP